VIVAECDAFCRNESLDYTVPDTKEAREVVLKVKPPKEKGIQKRKGMSQMTKRSLVVALFSIFLPFCCAKDAAVPEAAFLSSHRYTNAFFGFSLPLPEDPAFRVAPVSSSGKEHNLFGLGQERGHTAFVISAQPMNSNDAEQLMHAAQQTMIHGKEFSEGISHEERPQGTVWKAMYLTVIDSYLLEFNIQSFDRTMAEDLQHCVEETRFFDPAKAKAVAGPNSRPYNPALSHHPKN
jgi:hypothetical protein